MYEKITRFLPEFAAEKFGAPAEHPSLCNVWDYSGWVEQMNGEIMELVEEYRLADLHRYHDYLPDEDKAPDRYTEVEAMATLVNYIRGERFSSGAILTGLESGVTEACVRVLARADEARKSKKGVFRLFLSKKKDK